MKRAWNRGKNNIYISTPKNPMCEYKKTLYKLQKKLNAFLAFVPLSQRKEGNGLGEG